MLKWNYIQESFYRSGVVQAKAAKTGKGVGIMLKTGLSGEAKTMVVRENTALAIGSGSVPVFATPMLVALMEKAAVKALQCKLAQGQETVGIKLDIAHFAATPTGMSVTAAAELLKIDGRRLLFKVTAMDEKGPVGEGWHERYIIETEKFLSKVAEKKNSP